jgi:hypothetical protein
VRRPSQGSVTVRGLKEQDDQRLVKVAATDDSKEGQLLGVSVEAEERLEILRCGAVLHDGPDGSPVDWQGRASYE